jgi:hypothetical protein
LQADGATATEWQSVVELDAGLFSRASRPLAVQDLYLRCEGVPKVDIMQPYRDDTAICTKLYSDPGMFFDLWRKSMLEMAHKAKQYKRSKSKKKSNQNQARKVVQVTKIMTNAVSNRCHNLFCFKIPQFQLMVANYVHMYLNIRNF